jgi:hypothetical protein
LAEGCVSPTGHLTEVIYLRTLKSKGKVWAWWCTPGVPGLRRLRQKDNKFEDSLCYIARLYLKKENKKERHLNNFFLIETFKKQRQGSLSLRVSSAFC